MYGWIYVFGRGFFLGVFENIVFLLDWLGFDKYFDMFSYCYVMLCFLIDLYIGY